MAEPLLLTLEVDTRQGTAAIRDFNRRVESSVNRTTGSVTRQTDQASRSVDRLSGAFRGLGVAIAALGLVQIGQQVLQTAIRLDTLNRSFIAITGSAQAAQDTLGFVRREADRLGLDAISAAEGMRRLLNATRGTALEGEATREIFTALSEATIVLGLSTDEYGRALLAVSQIALRGKVQQEELNQLAEAGIPVQQQLARALGVSGEELQKMLQQGQVTSRELIPLFRQIRNELGEDGIQTAAQGAQREINRFNNNLRDLGQTLAVNVLPILTSVIAALNEIGKTPSPLDRLEERLRSLQASTAGLGSTGIPFIDRLVGQPETLRRVNQEIQQTEAAIRAIREGDDIGFGRNAAEHERAQAKIRAQNKKTLDERKQAEGQARLERQRMIDQEAEREARVLENFREERHRDNVRRIEEEIRARQRALQERVDDEVRAQEEIDRERKRSQDRQVRETERNLERQQREFDRFAGRIEDRLANVFESAFRGNVTNAVDFMKNAFFSAISQIAARFATTQFITPSISGLFGGLGDPLGGGLQGPTRPGFLGSIGNLLGGGIGNVLGIGSLIAGGVGLISGLFGGGGGTPSFRTGRNSEAIINALGQVNRVQEANRRAQIGFGFQGGQLGLTQFGIPFGGERVEGGRELSIQFAAAIQQTLQGVLQPIQQLSATAQQQLVPELNAAAGAFANAISDLEFRGGDWEQQLRQFVSQALPALAENIFGTINSAVEETSNQERIKRAFEANVVQPLETFLQSITGGPQSPLGPATRARIAGAQFNAAIRAQDTQAIIASANALISANRDRFASGPQFFDSFQFIIRQIENVIGRDVVGFQSGGAFRVGGRGGADSRLVSFRATPGELVTVATPESASSASRALDLIEEHTADQSQLMRELVAEVRTQRAEIKALRQRLDRMSNADRRQSA